MPHGSRHVHFIRAPNGPSTRTDAVQDEPGHTHVVFGIETGPPIRDGMDHVHEVNMPEDFSTTVGLVTSGMFEVGRQVSGLGIGDSPSRKGVFAGVGILGGVLALVALSDRRSPPPRLTGFGGNRSTHQRRAETLIPEVDAALENVNRALRSPDCEHALSFLSRSRGFLIRADENLRYAEDEAARRQIASLINRIDFARSRFASVCLRR